MNPVYCCINAYKTENGCVFAKCTNCHNKAHMKVQDRRRKGPSRKKDVDKDKEQCDHLNLNAIPDSLYFKRQYLVTCETDETPIYIQCVACRAYFTNNKKDV